MNVFFQADGYDDSAKILILFIDLKYRADFKPLILTALDTSKPSTFLNTAYIFFPALKKIFAFQKIKSKESRAMAMAVSAPIFVSLEIFIQE